MLHIDASTLTGHLEDGHKAVWLEALGLRTEVPLILRTVFCQRTVADEEAADLRPGGYLPGALIIAVAGLLPMPKVPVALPPELRLH